MWLLDTNICIYMIKRRPQAVFERARQVDIASIRISAITVAELAFGVAKSSRVEQNSEALTVFLAPFTVEAFDEAAADTYGRIRAHLERAGTPIGANDLLIAAHALSQGYTLVTNNEREFSRIPGLKVDNWV